MSSYIDKEYMRGRIQDRLSDLKAKYRALCSCKLLDGTPCSYAGAAVNRARVQKEMSTLKLIDRILDYTKSLDIDDEELVDAFDRLVEPRRKK